MRAIKQNNQKAIIVNESNKKIDFKKIKQAGIDIIIYKIPCNLYWNKKEILNRKEEIHKEKMLMGICLEFKGDKSANLQGMLISNIVSKINPDIYPVIEVNKNENLAKKFFSDKCLKCLNLIKKNINMECIIKSELKFANENLDIRFRDKMFWVVEFGKTKPSNSTIWNDWTCFSYSNKCLIDGIDMKFELSEVKESIVILQCCHCHECEHHKDKSNCLSMEGFIQGDIVAKLQEQLNIQFKAELEVNGCFTQETLDKCILIMKNAKGPITKIVQTRLVANGYDIGKTGIDGFYGENTINAVKKFQENYKIKPFGVINTNTWRELFIKR